MAKANSWATIKTVLLSRRRITASGCWEWTGGCGTDGYGKVTIYYVTHNVHRVAAKLWLELPDDSKVFVCHTCDNPRCFNPAHLYLGDWKSNATDALERSGKAYKAVVNTARTHCTHGHPFDAANTYIRPGGGRNCRRCHAEEVARRRL